MRPDDIDRYPEQPRPERAVGSKRPDAAPCADERLLGEILGVAVAGRHRTDQVQHGSLVPEDELVERVPTSRRSGVNEAAVRIHSGCFSLPRPGT
jgi:hypothetical protein